MTLLEARNILKKRGLYLLKENAYGSLEEYVAKLNDLWSAENEDSDDFETIDEIMKDEWYNSLIADLYDAETEPSEALEEIKAELSNDADIDSDYEEYQESEDEYNVDEDLDDEYLDDEYYDENGEHYPKYRDAVDDAERYYNSPVGDYTKANPEQVEEAVDFLRKLGFNAEPAMINEAREFDTMEPEYKEGLRRLKNNYSSAKSNHALNNAAQIDRYLRQFASFIPHVPNARGRALIMNWINELNTRRTALDLPELEVNPETGVIGTETAVRTTRAIHGNNAGAGAARPTPPAPRVDVPAADTDTDTATATAATEDGEEAPAAPARQRRTHMERRRRIRLDVQNVEHTLTAKQCAIFVEYGPDADTLTETRAALNELTDYIRNMYQNDPINSYIEPVTIIEEVPEKPNTISAVITALPNEFSNIRRELIRKIEDVFVFVEITDTEDATITVNVPQEVEVPEEYEVEVEDAPTPEEAAEELVAAAANGEVETRQVGTHRQPRTDIVRRLSSRARWKVTFKVNDTDETETVYVAARSAAEARAIVSRDPEDGGDYWNVGEIINVEED